MSQATPAPQEQDRYPYSAIVDRKPLRWPHGKRLAVMITTNLEYWDATKDTPKPFYPGGPGIVGGDLPGNVYDNPNYTWREYGQRVGVWRMFDIFDEFGVPAHWSEDDYAEKLKIGGGKERMASMFADPSFVQEAGIPDDDAGRKDLPPPPER